MGKRFLPTLLALSLFVALFIWVNLYEVEPIPEPGKDNPVDLAAVALDDVKALTWKTPGRPDIRVETGKTGEQRTFTLVQPRRLLGEESEFTGILSRFENLRSQRTVNPNATDTRVFGLGTDSPSLSIETATATITLTLGDQHPIGNACYLMKAGDPAVYLVGGEVQPAFRKTVDELRAKSLFTEDFSTFAAVSIRTPASEFKIERDKDNNWKLLEPKEMAADNSAVSGLIYGVRDLRAARFIENPAQANASAGPIAEFDAQMLKQYGLDKPELRIVLGAGTGTLELDMGKEENGERYVKRGDSPVVSLVPAAGPLNSLLGVDLDRLRNKDLPAFDRARVTSLGLKTASGSLELEKVATNWEFDGRKLDLSKANPLFDAWTVNRIQSFLPSKQFAAEGLTGDKVEELKIGLGTESVVVRFGKVENGQVAMMARDGEEGWKVPVALHDTFRNLYDAAKNAPPSVPAAPAGVQGALASDSRGAAPASATGAPATSAPAVSAGSPATGTTPVAEPPPAATSTSAGK